MNPVNREFFVIQAIRGLTTDKLDLLRYIWTISVTINAGCFKRRRRMEKAGITARSLESDQRGNCKM